MPILSVSTPPSSSNSTETISIIIEKPTAAATSSSSATSATATLCDCSVPCCNQHTTESVKSVSMQLPSNQKKRNTSLFSRDEDDYWVDISNKRLRNTRLGALYAGSRFKGVQKCGISKYNVMVDIQHVDLKESKISGYLNIEGLTNECPELTTFFEGEIIGPQYPFLTRKWQAQQYIDALHWGKFPSFEPFLHTFNDDDFTYDPFDNDFIYMRWKEHFLVPDHCVSNIEGASFAGFYYICYQRSTNEIKGFYFYHNNPEWFQQLVLEHVEEHSFSNFEFR
ncbi:hypothetical protein HMPREF1544_08329 [Mucor circinelloides 1006PhL]|uniref:Uncharacterized protein n=1 Tax=Mucor circinelloides f. circinelloides (strain 1006PhL) TaxID=1220926 RepID=S2J5I7_MUCC1|nr:hypothetical protein HMPREF1544_08329 [Mucor circinelloides 1006PhL]